MNNLSALSSPSTIQNPPDTVVPNIVGVIGAIVVGKFALLSAAFLTVVAFPTIGFGALATISIIAGAAVAIGAFLLIRELVKNILANNNEEVKPDNQSFSQKSNSASSTNVNNINKYRDLNQVEKLGNNFKESIKDLTHEFLRRCDIIIETINLAQQQKEITYEEAKGLTHLALFQYESAGIMLNYIHSASFWPCYEGMNKLLAETSGQVSSEKYRLYDQTMRQALNPEIQKWTDFFVEHVKELNNRPTDLNSSHRYKELIQLIVEQYEVDLRSCVGLLNDNIQSLLFHSSQIMA